MDRTILYDEEQADPFDLLWALKDTLTAVGGLYSSVSGLVIGTLSGFGATATGPTSLTINLAAGLIYQQSAIDGSPYGALAADSTVVQQQGLAAAQQITLSTAGLSAGQSMWALVEAQFAQTDAIRPTDPTGGVLNYWNSNDPTQPFQGPNNNGSPQPTVRLGTATVRVKYGTPATTGSEVPATPDAGWLPLYLIDLAFGQTTIATNQILVAGPSVGTGVPSNYPGAPFIAGLLKQHHLGIPGHAPQIDLASEVKGVLPGANGGSGITASALTGAAQTYANTQIGKLLLRSNSGAVMVDTLPGPTPGVITANGVIWAYNGDASALLMIQAGTGTTLNGNGPTAGGFVILGPGQTAGFQSDGTNYRTIAEPTRARLAANTTFYVSTSGSDTTGNGLAVGSPWATRQNAWNTLQKLFDLNGFTATIQLADGTYTAGLNAIGPMVGQTDYTQVLFQGNTGTMANCVINNAAGDCFSISDGARVAIQGFTLLSSNSALNVNGAGSILGIQGSIAIGACTSDQIATGKGGQIVINGSYSITGGGRTHFGSTIGGQITRGAASTITLVGTPAFSTAFAYADRTATLNLDSLTFAGTGATGSRYSVNLNAVIYTGGGGANYFPGNSAGSFGTGGEYA